MGSRDASASYIKAFGHAVREQREALGLSQEELSFRSHLDRTYISGVERCYRRHLKKHTASRGVVLVSFTVDPKGRARDGAARGVTEQVDGCIAAQVRQWRFPVPHKHGEAHFALGLELGAN